MALSYRFYLEPQENGWFLVRFPAIPEALTEGETESEAIENAKDCLLTALEGYFNARKALPKDNSDDFKGRRIALIAEYEIA